MKSMKIEKATIKDMENILELQKLAYLSEAEIYNDFTIPPLKQTVDEIKKDFLQQIFLKVIKNNKIIGSVRAYMKGDTCYIGKLIVHPDFQNQGIGKKLMNNIEQLFIETKRFELFTGHKSKKNLYLYQKLGYKRFKTEKVNNKLNFIYLEKIISN